MKAIRIHKQADSYVLVYEDVPQPQPAYGEVLVRIYASGVTPSELDWGTTWKTKMGIERRFPIPGHEMSGIISQVGEGVTDLKVGQAVYGFNEFDQDGSQAEYMIAQPTEVAIKPTSLTYEQAAAVPLAALTAWQALFDHAKLTAGQTVLIHGAAGGVGSFAVQLAHWAKAHVVAVDAPWNQDLLLKLACDEAIDFMTTPFEDVTRDVDVILDAAGVDGLVDRSWRVIRKGGTLISLAKPFSPEQAAPYDVNAIFFVVKPNRDALAQISQLIDAGQLNPLVSKVFPLSQAGTAYAQKKSGRIPGKIVLKVIT